jgi:hypothetical protein
MTTHRTAAQRPGRAAAVAPESVARQGVLSALPAQQQPTSPAGDDGRRPVAWLHVVAPPDWRATPTAHSWCACGRDRFVVGRRKALALVEDHNAHRATCPLLTRTEGRAAA